MYLLFSWMDFHIGYEVEEPSKLMKKISSVLHATFLSKQSFNIEVKIVANNIFSHVKQFVKWCFYSSGCL